MAYNASLPNVSQAYADVLASIRENFRAIVDGDSVWTVPKGGTGLTTIPTGRLLYGNGTSAISTSSSLTYDGTTFTILGTPSGNIFKVGATGGGDAILATAFAAGSGGLIGALDGTLADWEPLTLAGEGVFVDLSTGAGNKSNFAKFTNDMVTWTSGAAGLELYGPTNHAALRLAGPSSADVFLTSSSTAAYLYATTAVPLIIGLNNAEIGRFSGSSFNMGDTSTIYGRIQSTIGAGAAIPTLGVGSGHLTLSNGAYGLAAGVNTSGDSWIQAHRFDGTATAYNLLLQPAGGNVGIGSQSPLGKLDARATSGAQIVASYDASFYFSIAVNPTGVARAYCQGSEVVKFERSGTISSVTNGLCSIVRNDSGDTSSFTKTNPDGSGYFVATPISYAALSTYSTFLSYNQYSVTDPTFANNRVGAGYWCFGASNHGSIDGGVSLAWSELYDTANIAFMFAAGNPTLNKFASVIAQDTDEGGVYFTLPVAGAKGSLLQAVKSKIQAADGVVVLTLDTTANEIIFSVLYPDGTTAKTGTVSLS